MYIDDIYEVISKFRAFKNLYGLNNARIVFDDIIKESGSTELIVNYIKEIGIDNIDELLNIVNKEARSKDIIDLYKYLETYKTKISSKEYNNDLQKYITYVKEYIKKSDNEMKTRLLPELLRKLEYAIKHNIKISNKNINDISDIIYESSSSHINYMFVILLGPILTEEQINKHYKNIYRNSSYKYALYCRNHICKNNIIEKIYSAYKEHGIKVLEALEKEGTYSIEINDFMGLFIESKEIIDRYEDKNRALLLK